ncbi:MAG: hypothetical protein EHM19_13550 [Candidatus Latescibacterota bacterium]|nr:MAG: hypothetical protein EHM19_13550 [Candidatus Latescibacterota bacterium]
MRLLFKVCLALVAAHALFLFGFPHILHRLLAMRVREIVAESTLNSEEYIRGEILGYAEDKKIPLEEDRLVVWRKDGKVRVWLAYDQVVRVPFYTYSKSFLLSRPEGAEPPRNYKRIRSASAR